MTETTSGTRHGGGQRVCLVTQWYDPEPVNVPMWLVRALRRQGLNVSVLTGVPNYPDGKVFTGYSARRTGNELVDGVFVRRTPLYPSHDQSAVKRVANYTSWAVSSAVLGHRLLRTADAALVYSSPATAATASMVARATSGTPYVLMIEDVWPDSVFASGFLGSRGAHRLLRETLERFVDLTYRHAAHIVVVSPGVIDLLVRRGVPRDKVSLVYNWADEQVFRPVPADGSIRSSLGISDTDFVLMYAGNHGPAQGLETAIEAFASMQNSHNRHLVLVGEGISKNALKEVAARTAPTRVHFVDGRSAKEMPAVLAAADAQLVSLRDEPLFRVTMPGKMQTCLASGLPTIVAARGDAAQVAMDSSSGLVAVPGDPASLATAVAQMADMGASARNAMGESARHWYRENMAEEVGAAKLAAILRRVASRRDKSNPNSGQETASMPTVHKAAAP